MTKNTTIDLNRHGENVQGREALKAALADYLEVDARRLGIAPKRAKEIREQENSPYIDLLPEGVTLPASEVAIISSKLVQHAKNGTPGIPSDAKVDMMGLQLDAALRKRYEITPEVEASLMAIRARAKEQDRPVYEVMREASQYKEEQYDRGKDIAREKRVSELMEQTGGVDYAIGAKGVKYMLADMLELRALNHRNSPDIWDKANELRAMADTPVLEALPPVAKLSRRVVQTIADEVIEDAQKPQDISLVQQGINPVPFVLSATLSSFEGEQFHNLNHEHIKAVEVSSRRYIAKQHTALHSGRRGDQDNEAYLRGDDILSKAEQETNKKDSGTRWAPFVYSTTPARQFQVWAEPEDFTKEDSQWARNFAHSANSFVDPRNEDALQPRWTMFKDGTHIVVGMSFANRLFDPAKNGDNSKRDGSGRPIESFIGFVAKEPVTELPILDIGNFKPLFDAVLSDEVFKASDERAEVLLNERKRPYSFTPQVEPIKKVGSAELNTNPDFVRISAVADENALWHSCALAPGNQSIITGIDKPRKRTLGTGDPNPLLKPFKNIISSGIAPSLQDARAARSGYDDSLSVAPMWSNSDFRKKTGVNLESKSTSSSDGGKNNNSNRNVKNNMQNVYAAAGMAGLGLITGGVMLAKEDAKTEQAEPGQAAPPKAQKSWVERIKERPAAALLFVGSVATLIGATVYGLNISKGKSGGLSK